MFHVPVPPPTFVTRQIECISCKELFTIAEDVPYPTNKRSSSWRLPPDRYPDIALRYQENRTHRPVSPEMRAEPDSFQQIPYSTWAEASPTHIYCPRCGADNRNWLHIISPPPTKPLRQIQNWINYYPYAAFALCFTICLWVLALIRVYTNTAVKDMIVLSLNLLLAGCLPVFVITRQWKSLREYQFTHQVKKSLSQSGYFAPPFKTGFLMGFVFVTLIPFLIYIIIPLVLNFSTSFIQAPPPEPTLIDRIKTVSDKLESALESTDGVPSNSTQQTIKELETILQTHQEKIETSDIEEGKIEASTEENESTDSAESASEEPLNFIARAKLTLTDIQVLSSATPEYDAQIDSAIRKLETAISLSTPTKTSTADEEIIDHEFLKIWFKYVGFTSFISTILSCVAVWGYTNRVNAHLPRPIFYSIPKMTRVAVWEAKHALEIPGDTSNIQWSYIKRNEQGGIILQGIYREPVLNGYRTDLYHRVRAQIYTISTDLWGRIETADIQTTTAPQSPESPSVSMAHDLFRNTLPAPSYPVQLLR